jgi:hypothetical protein
MLMGVRIFCRDISGVFDIHRFCRGNVPMTTMIRCADGFAHTTNAPVRVLPRGTCVDIQEWDSGTWDPLYSTPYAVEIEVRP